MRPFRVVCTALQRTLPLQAWCWAVWLQLARLAIFLVLVSCRCNVCYYNHNSGKKIETELRVCPKIRYPRVQKYPTAYHHVLLTLGVYHGLPWSTSPSCPSCPSHSHSTTVAAEPTDSHPQFEAPGECQGWRSRPWAPQTGTLSSLPCSKARW